MQEVVNGADAAVGPATPRRHRPFWALPAVLLAIVAVAIALVVGISGLTGNPVGATDASGVTTLHGEFEPFDCGAGCVRGYLQAGGRSVFVLFPSGCAAPARAVSVTVSGRLDTNQGKASYQATGCGTAGG